MPSSRRASAPLGLGPSAEGFLVFLLLVSGCERLVASGWLLVTNFEVEVVRECSHSNHLAIDGFGRSFG